MSGESADREAKRGGSLGLRLEGLIHSVDVIYFTSLPFSEQISFVYKPKWQGRTPSQLSRAALSYMYALVPVQVPLRRFDIVKLLELLPLPPELRSLNVARPSFCDRKWSERMFPYKPAPQSITKVNLYLDEVVRDGWKLDKVKTTYICAYLPLLIGKATNDVATNFFIYAWCLWDLGFIGVRWAAWAVTAPKEAKEVSNFLKAIGANATRDGARLVEVDTLQGRGVGKLDLVAGAKERCDIDFLRENMIVEYPDSTIRDAIRTILEEEIVHSQGSTRVEFESVKDHWNSRWQWAVNGSHSSLVDQRLKTKTRIPGLSRMHRRAWLETQKNDPRDGWDGYTAVSASAKLENGKTRAIYACDTVSYLAFEHLLGPVERAWRGVHVILNPGKGGHFGMAERVARNRNRSGISLMLDYDDFNSHHSTRAMQIIFEELVEITGYDTTLGARLVRSFTDEHVFVEGRRVGHIKGTLMSGHRATTFINSVLNRAYLMCELGKDFIADRPSLHTGDDVYLGVRTYSEAAYVVTRIMESRLRMNPSKQSVGHVSTEFLRVASDQRDSYGYLARGIAGLVSGNWVNDNKLDPFAGLTTMIASARTLANRAHSQEAPLLLMSAVRRNVGRDSLDDACLAGLLRGNIALNDGPQFISSGARRHIVASISEPTVDDYGYTALPQHSTTTFLSNCASDLELTILTECGLSVRKDMLRSSYKKSLGFSVTGDERLQFSSPISAPAVGSARVEDLLRAHKPRGVLSRFPLLVLAKERLPDATLRRAVGMAGGNPSVQDIKLESWGEYSHGCIVNTVLSYSDAAAFGKVTAASVLTSTRRCHV